MNKNDYYKLTRTLSDLEIARGKAELAVKNAETELRSLVKFVNGRGKKSIYLSFKNRTIRCEPCWKYKNRYNIYENGKRIRADYLWGIHDIRLQLALGRI